MWLQGKEEKIEVLKKLKDVVFNSEVPAKRISFELGIDYTQLSMMCSENSLKKGKPKFPLVYLPELIRITDRTDFMEYLCNLTGGIYTRVDDIEVDEPVESLKELRDMLLEVSNYITLVIKSHEDGEITEKEMQAIAQQTRKLIAQLIKIETFTASVHM